MDTISQDLLRGAGEIAEFLFGDAGERRAVYEMVKRKQLPIFHSGAIICARKSRLRAHVEEQEKASIAPSNAR
jgi:hypothetical protein